MATNSADFVLRERPFWEAVDFGSLLYRRFAARLILYFGLPFAIVSCAAIFLLLPVSNLIPIAVLWWLKPLWDRLILLPAGILFFKPEATNRELITALKRIWNFSLLADLSWRRFSPFIAFLLPVRLLEGAEKNVRRTRRKWLSMDLGGQLFGLAAVFVALEIGATLSIYYSIYILVSVQPFGSEAGLGPDGLKYLLDFSYAASVLVFEALYALSCFALYTNKRTVHEAWDLKLLFTRLKSHTINSLSRSLLLLASLAIFAAIGPKLEAQAFSTAPVEDEYVSRSVDEALKSPDFGRTESHYELRFRDQEGTSSDKPGETSPGNRVEFAGAVTLRIVAIVAGTGLLVFFVTLFFLRVAKKAPKRGKRKRTGTEVRETAIEGTRVGNWAESSMGAWNEGRKREALSQLYRAAIATASEAFRIRVPSSRTEKEVLDDIRSRDDEFGRFCGTLIRAWEDLAWGARIPDESLFLSLRDGLLSWEHRV